MMPIFFHSQAHLWIAYALFFNGFCLNLILLKYSIQYRELAKPLEAQVIISFGLSLGFNGLVLLSLDWLTMPFSLGLYALVTLSIVCLIIVSLGKLYQNWLRQLQVSWPAMMLYLSMFVILFYNGGMIDQVSDAWWHMSLANKIGWASSFTLEQGHLTGAPDRYYPPLWHGNLALLRELSDQQLPIIWNAFTAWGGVLKLMGYYLLGLALFKDRTIAFTGALMFALLSGFGNSYMRVSAWPSHIAYVFWFFSLSIAFKVMDLQSDAITIKDQLLSISKNYLMLCGLVLVLALIYLSHQFEILLFVGGLFLYFAGLSVARIFGVKGDVEWADRNKPLYIWCYRLGLVVLICSAVLIAFKFKDRAHSVDSILVLAMPIALFAIMLLADAISSSYQPFSKALLLFALAMILVSLNYQHLASLVYPEMALPLSGSNERPVLATGWFGQQLSLPGWHLQLRNGLLWSGAVGAILSIAMAVYRPSRAWIWFASNCIFVWVLCSSPYLYQWLADALRYHSTWRFGMLSFHQLAVAAVMVYLVRELMAVKGSVAKHA